MDVENDRPAPTLLRTRRHAAAGAPPTRRRPMRYMLMMNAPRGTGHYAANAWSPDDLKAHIGFMFALNRELAESGELVGAEGLAAPGEAKIVRAGKNGVPAVTDGPFPESKEFLAGY